MTKILKFLLIFSIVISTLGFLFVYNFEIIDPKMEFECNDYLSDTKVGEQRCCQIGWSYDKLQKYPLERCVLLQ